MKKPTQIFLSALLGVFTASCFNWGAIAADGTADSAVPASGTEAAPAVKSSSLRNGIYLVLRQSQDPKALEPTTGREQVLINDSRFLEPEERGKADYVVLSEEAFIPIVLGGEPQKGTDNNGRTKLMLELAQTQVAPLEEFTRKNEGKGVAIVIGGDVVSMHKIREPIVGGRMQITRCTDNGCEVIYSRLQEERRP